MTDGNLEGVRGKHFRVLDADVFSMVPGDKLQSKCMCSGRARGGVDGKVVKMTERS